MRPRRAKRQAGFKWLVNNLGLIRALGHWCFPLRTTASVTRDDMASAKACWWSTTSRTGKGKPQPGVATPPSPFLLVKPFGLADLKRIREIVGRDRIVSELAVSGYARLANALFPQVREVERLVWTVLTQRLLPQEEADAACLLILRAISPEEVGPLKHRIRRKVGIRFFRVVLEEECQETSVTPVHAPGPSELAREWSIVMAHVKGEQ